MVPKQTRQNDVVLHIVPRRVFRERARHGSAFGQNNGSGENVRLVANQGFRCFGVGVLCHVDAQSVVSKCCRTSAVFNKKYVQLVVLFMPVTSTILSIRRRALANTISVIFFTYLRPMKLFVNKIIGSRRFYTKNNVSI
jgi:hypothetical protein